MVRTPSIFLKKNAILSPLLVTYSLPRQFENFYGFICLAF
jgi:hypothetical protein